MTKTREVKVSGGPGRDVKIDSWKVQVTVDYTNVTREELETRAFAHDVVRLQNGTLRDATRVELDGWSINGYSIAGELIGAGKRAPADPKRTMRLFLIGAGWSETDADTLVNDPGKFAEAMKFFKSIETVE